MNSHRIGTREDWVAASAELLKGEKELDLTGSCLFAAAVAVEVSPHVASAAGEKRLTRGESDRGEDSSPRVVRSSAHELSVFTDAARPGAHGRSLPRRCLCATGRGSPASREATPVREGAGSAALHSVERADYP